MRHAPNPIYESKSGRTTLSLVFTILMTGALFIILPMTQLSSKASSIGSETGIRMIPEIPPPKYIEPPKPEKKKPDAPEDITMHPPFEKVNIRDMEHILEGTSGPGARKLMGNFRSQDFPIETLIWDVENLDTAPKPLVKPAPPYPHSLKINRVQGVVEVEFIVTDRGRVTNITVKRATNREFAEAVLNTLRRWSFEPGKVEDKAVSTRVRIPFQFNLK